MLTSTKVGLVRDRDGVDAPHGLALYSRNQPKNESIEAFIAAEADKPFVWGETDCVSTAARWVHIHSGIDLSPAIGVYGTQGEAERAMSEVGGLAVAVNRLMRKVGFKKIKDPRPGDVGLIIHNGKLCVAVHGGELWFSHDESGLIGAPLSSVWKAWEV